MDEHRMCEPINSRLKAAHAVTQALWQHRNHSIRQINAVPALARFAIKCATRLNVSSDIGDVHTELPTAVVDPFNLNRVVEIARIIRIDCDNKFVPQIFASLEFPRIDCFGDPVRFIENISRKVAWQMIFPNDRQHVDARRRGWSKYFDDVAFWINVA